VSYPSTPFGGDGHAPAAQATQATFVMREILSASAVGFPLAVVYDLRDDGTDPTNSEHNYGLIANDYSDKPAAVGVRTLGDVAQGRVFKGLLDLQPASLNAMRLDGPRDVVVALGRACQGKVPVTLVNAKRRRACSVRHRHLERLDRGRTKTATYVIRCNLCARAPWGSDKSTSTRVVGSTISRTSPGEVDLAGAELFDDGLVELQLGRAVIEDVDPGLDRDIDRGIAELGDADDRRGIVEHARVSSGCR
jgi:hypothetical protein